MERRAFIKALGYSTLAGISCCPSHVPSSPIEYAKKVLLIGVDGVRPDALQEARTPNIDLLVANGAYNFAARTGEFTVSGPGWSNILTGVWESKHGVKDNSFEGANYEQYPTVFTRLEKYKHSLQTSCLASWESITKMIVPQADLKIYHPFGDDGDRIVARDAAYALRFKPIDFMFAYFMGVDEAGHNHGFDPAVKEYLSEIETIDRYVGLLMDGLRKRQDYRWEDWLTILVSDHGGKGKSHGGVGEEAMKVPLIMHGSGVQKGEILPIPGQVDVAPTILNFMGIPVKSEWNLDGKVVGLK